MPDRILIAPGQNAVLLSVAQQLESYPDIAIFESANAMLWEARQTLPAVVLADERLADMSGADLAEILPLLSPGVRVIICGSAEPQLAQVLEATGGQLVAMGDSPDRSLQQVYQALGSSLPAAAPAEDPEGASTPQMEDVQPQRPVDAHPSAEPWEPKDGSVVVHAQQLAAVQKMLETLAADIRAQCILLNDTGGMPLLKTGIVPPELALTVGPLLAPSLFAMTELARQIHDPDPGAAYLYEGARYSIYAFNAGFRYTLTLIFDRHVYAANLASVWGPARHMAAQLRAALEE